MKRRDLLTLAPAALIGCTAPANACTLSLDETPVGALFREWQALTALVEDGDLSTEEIDRLADERNDVHWRMLETPTNDAMDMLMKVCAATEYGECNRAQVGHDCPWSEVRALVGVQA